MCTIAILLGVVADAPLVLAANRDELYARPTRPPERWGSGIVGGVDVLSGGTWMAVRADGRFAAVTNQRALATPPPGLRSRGLVVKELAETDDPAGYIAALDARRYASMNLVWGDANGVTLVYARHEGSLELERIGPGIHVLANDRLGADGFPRAQRLAAVIAEATQRGARFGEISGLLASALGDHTRLPLEEVPPSHLPPALARELTATCIHSESYGTRSASIFAAAPGRALHLLHADGPPCTTAFVDRSELL